MGQTNRTPTDLAFAVANELRRRKEEVPPMPVLTQLFETLYFASLKTEEAQPIHCYVVYLNPSNPDPSPPEFAPKDRWGCVALEERIPLTVSSLVKIAKASDPRTSSFAVYHSPNRKLFIWGLVDQGNQFHEFVNYNSDISPERPGLFQAAILGIGHLVAYRGYDRIAELKIDTLVTESYDVLRHGPVRELLEPAIADFIGEIRTIVAEEAFDDRVNWPAELTEQWIATISRLLLRMQGYRHGGALLITPESEVATTLDVKYRLQYARLKTALVNRAAHQIKKSCATDRIFDVLDGNYAGTVPAKLFLDEVIEQDDFEQSTSELDSAIWFVSLLSRVDGLVLLTRNLEVSGFGVEILVQTHPSKVVKATTAAATARSLRRVEYQHFGTRHRSMMRYCFSVPGSIGFVVSQDGDVRVMTRVGDALVMWESVRLQLDQFIRGRSRARSQRSRPRADEAEE